MPEQPVPHRIYREGHDKALQVLEQAATIDADLSTGLDDVQQTVRDDHRKFLERIVKDMQVDQDDPEKLLGRAFEALGKVESRQFVIQNLLESVKQGKSLRDTITKYHEIGLIDVKPPQPPKPPQPGSPDGRFLATVIKWTKKFTLALFQIILNAFKAIPNFCKIKPSVGFVGAFPSLTFELETESVTIADLYEYLTR